jgi:replicative DNA helicase
MSNINQEEIEKKFLCYLFTNKRYIAMSMGTIKKEHLPNTYFIYSLLKGYFNNYRDVITDDIVDIMFEKKNLNKDTAVKYKTMISEIKNKDINNNESEFNALMDELKDSKKRQDILNMAENIITINPLDCSNGKLEELEGNIQNKVMKLNSEDTSVRKEGDVRNSTEERLERYEHIKNNPEAFTVIPTGFKHVDEQEGGFRPGELIYIIGRKGSGKSVLMLNLGHNAWKEGYNVILFSLEISKEDYERRFDARAAGVPSNGLKQGDLTPKEEKIYQEYLKSISEGKTPNGDKTGMFYVVDVPKGCTPAFIESKIETLEQMHDVKFDVVISDYAGIMQPNVPVAEKRHEQGNIAYELKGIARSKDCVVISGAQMSRKGRDEDRAESAHIAESDQVGDHLDWGIAIQNNTEETGIIESFKTRDAAPFKFHFKKKFSHMNMMEMEDSLDDWDGLEEL